MYDILEFQIAQFLYKARNNLLPCHLLKMFHEREGGYDLRETLNFKIQRCRTTMKRFCITNNGVRLWNRLSEDLKQCPSIKQFKNKYKDTGRRGLEGVRVAFDVLLLFLCTNIWYIVVIYSFVYLYQCK